MKYVIVFRGERVRTTNSFEGAKAIQNKIKGSQIVALKECPMIKATCCTHEYYNNSYRNGKTYLRIA